MSVLLLAGCSDSGSRYPYPASYYPSGVPESSKLVLANDVEEGGSWWWSAQVIGTYNPEGETLVEYLIDGKQQAVTVRYLALMPTGPSDAQVDDLVIALWSDDFWHSATVVSVAEDTMVLSDIDEGSQLEVRKDHVTQPLILEVLKVAE